MAVFKSKTIVAFHAFVILVTECYFFVNMILYSQGNAFNSAKIWGEITSYMTIREMSDWLQIMSEAGWRAQTNRILKNYLESPEQQTDGVGLGLH